MTTPAKAPRGNLKNSHLSMMALGSAIGAGFFLGTGVAISQAGPAVLISYALAALIAISVMYCLAELASALPSSGSFSTYAQAGIGRWAGFTVGWMYWFMLIMVLGLEITGAATIFIGWFPQVPQWVIALAIVVVLGGVNLRTAGEFGTIEAWLAGIKVAAIAVFLLVGLGLVFNIIPGRTLSLSHNLLGEGGFAPAGVGGIVLGLLAVVTSFGGIEIVTIAAAEAEDAKAAMGAAIRQVVWRIMVFYIGTVTLLVLLLPWNSAEMKNNPLAAVLNMAGVPAVGLIMEIIVFIALISSFSANVYASSRLAYSLSARNMGSTWLLGKKASTQSGQSEQTPQNETVNQGTSAILTQEEELTGDMTYGRTPRRAVWISILLSLVSVALNWYVPDQLLGILLNAIGLILLVAWLFIVISQIRLHHKLEKLGIIAIRTPLWPWLSWAALAGVLAVFVLLATTANGRGNLVVIATMTLIAVITFKIRERVVGKV